MDAITLVTWPWKDWEVAASHSRVPPHKGGQHTNGLAVFWYKRKRRKKWHSTGWRSLLNIGNYFSKYGKFPSPQEDEHEFVRMYGK